MNEEEFRREEGRMTGVESEGEENRRREEKDLVSYETVVRVHCIIQLYTVLQYSQLHSCKSTDVLCGGYDLY